jgi:4-diphosphocytidyl-2-C-methyl-D-erythritol kinase
LSNDLQEAACRLAPYLRATLDVGHRGGALGAVVSGSGPTVAFGARDNEHALHLAVALTASGVARSVKRVHGPVHGARQVEAVRSPTQPAT